MSKFYFLLICLFSVGFLSAQEKLTKEEKARRDKNIQAGNPFAKFGSKVKIATLSKGKYLEFHDLDSIVVIGTIRWHVYKNKIVGDIIIDSINPDARPIGDAAGLWISPDPLSEEFPSWSPYSFSFNNPIRFVDPDGRAPFDHIFNANGRFIRDTGIGNAVKVQLADGSLVSPSQLSTSGGSKFAMRNIAAFYAANVGVPHGTKISTYSGRELSKDNAAHCVSKSEIGLNTNGGFSPDLNYIESFKSIIKHEDFHRIDFESDEFDGDLSTHVDVYINQMSDNSFAKTNDEFKTGMAGSLGQYLLNMDKKEGFGQNLIQEKMDSFNSSNLGGLIIQRAGGNIGMYPKGTLNLEVLYKGQTYPVPNKKIDE